MTKNDTAARFKRQAAGMVDAAFAETDVLHLKIYPDTPYDPLPACCQWRTEREAGISFGKSERAAAIEWTAAILAAGWHCVRSR